MGQMKVEEHPAYIAPEEFKNHCIDNDKFNDWYLIPYKYGKHSNLHLDTYLSDDRHEFHYFLDILYHMIRKQMGIDDMDQEYCDYLASGDFLCKCECSVCKKLWEIHDKEHTRIVCKHCGIAYYLTNEAIERNRKYFHSYMKDKEIKYPITEYCHKCSFRLEILAGVCDG